MVYTCKKSILRIKSSTSQVCNNVNVNVIQFSLNYLSSGRLREVKNNENLKLFALKVVTYKRF